MKFVLLDIEEDLKLDVAISVLKQEKVPYNIKREEKNTTSFLFNALSNYAPIECNIEVFCSLEKFEFIKHIINKEYEKMKSLENCYEKDSYRAVDNQTNKQDYNFKHISWEEYRRKHRKDYDPFDSSKGIEIKVNKLWDFPHFDL